MKKGIAIFFILVLLVNTGGAQLLSLLPADQRHCKLGDLLNDEATLQPALTDIGSEQILSLNSTAGTGYGDSRIFNYVMVEDLSAGIQHIYKKTVNEEPLTRDMRYDLRSAPQKANDDVPASPHNNRVPSFNLSEFENLSFAYEVRESEDIFAHGTGYIFYISAFFGTTPQRPPDC